MGQFRKKPVVIEATQFNKPGDHLAVEAGFSMGKPPAFCVRGKQGWVNVDPGDWIIAEMDGDGHYPCKPAVFAATYDPV
jgi:hypothetical protein